MIFFKVNNKTEMFERFVSSDKETQSFSYWQSYVKKASTDTILTEKDGEVTGKTTYLTSCVDPPSITSFTFF